MGKGLPSLSTGWKPRKLTPARKAPDSTPRRHQPQVLGELINSAEVELSDGRYRVARHRSVDSNDTNVIPVVVNLKTGEEVRPLRPILHRIIDERELEVSKYREKPNASDPYRGNRTLVYNIIRAVNEV